MNFFEAFTLMLEGRKFRKQYWSGKAHIEIAFDGKTLYAVDSNGNRIYSWNLPVELLLSGEWEPVDEETGQ